MTFWHRVAALVEQPDLAAADELPTSALAVAA
jgi:hypothetical protein